MKLAKLKEGLDVNAVYSADYNTIIEALAMKVLDENIDPKDIQRDMYEALARNRRASSR